MKQNITQSLPPFFTLENRKTLIRVQLHSTCELDGSALVTVQLTG